MHGKNVSLIQDALNIIFVKYNIENKINDEYSFGPKTEKAVKIFQRMTNLKVDGIVGTKTWYAILGVANLIYVNDKM